jgi:hypothetical protein
MSERTSNRASDALPSGNDRCTARRTPGCRRRAVEALKSRIAGLARFGGRNRVAAERKIVERAALETIGDLLPASAILHEVVAIARLPEQLEFFVLAIARQRITRPLIELDQLRFALGRHRKLRNEVADRPAIAAVGRDVVAHRHRIAGNERVAPEMLARKEDAARQVERSLLRTTFRRRLGCFTAWLVTCLIGACDLIEPGHVQLERDDLTLQRCDLGFERLDLRGDNCCANAAHDEEDTQQCEQPSLDVSPRTSGRLGELIAVEMTAPDAASSLYPIRNCGETSGLL